MSIENNINMDEAKCKGIIQQGPRKGMQCLQDKSPNGYCVYHQRNYEHERLTNLGKKLCNGFYRGCNNELSTEDLNNQLKNCSVCRIKKSGKEFPCSFKGCSAKIKVESDKYCNKHVRELLRDNEKEKNIQYCDISRGCFNILDNDIKCTECRNKERQKAASELLSLRKIHGIELPERKEKDELFEKQESIVSEIKEVWRTVQRNAMYGKRLFTLTQEEFESIVTQPCYYCGFYSNYKFIGIDRIDNNKGYIYDNCIPSCKMCNMMKHTDHPNAFLDKVSLICTYRQVPTSIRNPSEVLWANYLTHGKSNSYNEYKYVAEKKRNIQFLLSMMQYDKLINGECYLCGINPMNGHNNGVDRVDNTGNYTFDNCRSCCNHCNKMKRDYSYDDFIRKCIQIKTHSCDRTKFANIPCTDYKVQQLHNEYYTADDILKFIRENRITQFLVWCEEKDKTSQFMSAIKDIALHLDDDSLNKIKRELEKERARKYSLQSSSEKTHLHSATIYCWLTTGKEVDFVNWYASSFEPTALFDAKFKELMNELPSMSKEDGIQACKKFMHGEKSRRSSQHGRDNKKRDITKYSPKKESLQTVIPVKQVQPVIQIQEKNVIIRKITIANKLQHKETPQNILVPVDKTIEEIKVKQDVEYQNTVSQATEKKNNSDTSLPKQWKCIDIYKYITAGKENDYYTYLKESNDIDVVTDFESQWNTLLQNVKNKSFADAEESIRTFVLWLRNIRHNQICAVKSAKKSLEKEDREYYRTDGVLIILKNNTLEELGKFKNHTETYAGDNSENPAWIKRWNGFLEDVAKQPTDEMKRKIISNFLSAQRKKKNDRVHKNTK